MSDVAEIMNFLVASFDIIFPASLIVTGIIMAMAFASAIIRASSSLSEDIEIDMRDFWRGYGRVMGWDVRKRKPKDEDYQYPEEPDSDGELVYLDSDVEALNRH